VIANQAFVAEPTPLILSNCVERCWHPNSPMLSLSKHAGRSAKLSQHARDGRRILSVGSIFCVLRQAQDGGDWGVPPPLEHTNVLILSLSKDGRMLFQPNDTLEGEVAIFLHGIHAGGWLDSHACVLRQAQDEENGLFPPASNTFAQHGGGSLSPRNHERQPHSPHAELVEARRLISQRLQYPKQREASRLSPTPPCRAPSQAPPAAHAGIPPPALPSLRPPRPQARR
jgi:hypothetical protein